MIAFGKPPKKPIGSEIFIDDVNELVKEISPNWEGDHPLFKKFGVRIGGLYDSWVFSKDWENLPEIDKWKYVALCEKYWHAWNQYYYEKKEYEEYKEALKKWAKKNPKFLDTLKKLEEMETEGV